MFNLQITFLLGVLICEIGIAYGDDTKSCLPLKGFSLSVFQALSDKMTCATAPEILATPSVNVAYNGAEILCDASKYGQGEYHYFGYNTDDNSKVYIQANYDAVRTRSVILLDWQGENNWIGTRDLGTHRPDSTWLYTDCTEKKIEDCVSKTWKIRADELNWKDEVSISEVPPPTAATEATEATEPTEATEATEATDATEETEATEATNATEATGAPEATEGTEETGATEATDATEATKESPKPEVPDPPQSTPQPVKYPSTLKPDCVDEDEFCSPNEPSYECCGGLECIPSEIEPHPYSCVKPGNEN